MGKKRRNMVGAGVTNIGKLMGTNGIALCSFIGIESCKEITRNSGIGRDLRARGKDQWRSQDGWISVRLTYVVAESLGLSMDLATYTKTGALLPTAVGYGIQGDGCKEEADVEVVAYADEVFRLAGTGDVIKCSVDDHNVTRDSLDSLSE
jgi:hypothetical protein